MSELARELRIAARGLARRPTLSAAAVLTIALGIGATTAVFSVVYAVVLRPLPYPEPDRLVQVLEINQGEGLSMIPASARDFLAWREQAATFSHLTAFSSPQKTLATGTGEGQPERVPSAVVRAGFFELFGVAPALGRGFVEGEDAQDAANVVVLSHGLWERRFGSDPGVLGTTVHVDGEAARIVGVMPASFRFPVTAQMWTPLVFSQAQLEDRNWHFAHTLGRLAPGVELEAANAELRAIAARQAEAFPDSNGNWSAGAFPLHAQLVGDTGATLWALLAAVGFVLLIGLTNVANLLLVRAAGRRRETAVRSALGASRSQLLRQLLAEGALLAAAGCVAGLALAALGLDAMLAMSPITVPGGAPVEIARPVLLFAVSVSVVATMAFGLTPLASYRGGPAFAALREGSRGGAGEAGTRVRSLLVVTEISLAVVLVVGAATMVDSLRSLLREDPGFPAEGLLAAQLALPAERYDSPEAMLEFWSSLLERVEAIPGVESAGTGSWLPPISGPLIHHRVEGVHTAWTIDLPAVRSRHVSPEYLQALGVPLVRGRLLNADDRPETRRVAVVDEAFVAQLFEGEDPIGRQIRVWQDEPREIVGVVGNVKNTGLAGSAEATSYIPLSQTPWPNQGILVRTAGDLSAVVPALREAVHDLDPTLPLFGVETMADRLRDSAAQPLFQTRFLALFSGLALLLASVGIYGTMARVVSERTAEIGLRVALGATTSEVKGIVLRRGLTLTALGLVLGLVGAWGARAALGGFMFGIEAMAPWVPFAVAAVLAAVALAACWMPATRASRLDPVRALGVD